MAEVCKETAGHARTQVLAYENVAYLPDGTSQASSAVTTPKGVTTGGSSYRSGYSYLSDAKAIEETTNMFSQAVCASTRGNWVDVTGVYTPSLGQNHDSDCSVESVAACKCKNTCATASCSTFGTDTSIIASCSACYPRDATEAGCFPGASGFPTTALTEHTVYNLLSDRYYIFQIAGAPRSPLRLYPAPSPLNAPPPHMRGLLKTQVGHRMPAVQLGSQH